MFQKNDDDDYVLVLLRSVSFLIQNYFLNVMLPIRRNLLVLYSLQHSLLPLSSKGECDLQSLQEYPHLVITVTATPFHKLFEMEQGGAWGR